MNDSVVRLGVFEGEYHWHKHDVDDEFFYVVEGQLLIDLEDRTRRGSIPDRVSSFPSESSIAPVHRIEPWCLWWRTKASCQPGILEP